MKVRDLLVFRAVLLACCCGLAACQNGAGAPHSSASKSAPPPSGTTVVLDEPAGATSSTQATGANIVTIDPSGNSVSLERQLSWGIVHAAHRISGADLVRLNSDNAPHQREEFASRAGRVRVTEYTEIDGEFAVRYIFAIFDAGDAQAGSIALTSFRSPTQIDREMGRIGEDMRLFHLEDYRHAGNVVLLAVYETEPVYEVVRTRVLALLSQ